MFILGVISFFQVIFIPGFILVKYLNLVPANGSQNKGADILRTLVYAFAFSLLINYMLVFTGTLLGIYTPLYLYIILALEFLLLGFYWYCESGPEAGGIDLNGWVNGFREFIDGNSIVFNLLFFLSLAVILLYVFYFFYFLGSVFMHWDPVASWNRFALDWAGNKLPDQSWRYPQLIPANWSVSYVIMQTTGVEAFAKATMPLFSMATLLLFMELALRRRCSVYLVGLTAYGLLLSYLYNPSVIVSGYVDIAVSFFAFLAFHAVYGLKHDVGKRKLLRALTLAVIFASTAAITKQAGLFILLVILVFSSLAFSSLSRFKSRFKARARLPAKTIFKTVLFFLLIVSVITVSWYGLKEIQISKGLDRSMIQKVQDVHKQKDPSKRFGQAMDELLTHRHVKLKPLILLFLLFVLLGLFRRESWWSTLFIAIPFTLIWGFFFSYDLRNLSLAVPFMAFSGAFGIAFIKVKSGALLSRLKAKRPIRLPVKYILLFVVLLLAVLNFAILDHDTLLRHQRKQMTISGEPDVNRRLYHYHEKNGITGNIATNYLYLRRLPGLMRFFYHGPARISPGFMDMLESEQGRHIHFLLMPLILKSEKEVHRRSRRKLASGQWKIIFRSGGYRFIKIRR